MIIIIGSGLSGMAAAAALVKRGYKPVVLDTGVKPEAETETLKERLRSVEPESWSREDVSRLKRIGPAASNGIPQKLHFGSSFAYRDVDSTTSPVLTAASMYRSFARGGFSNLWGAAIEPLPENEFQHWPMAPADLTRHYGSVEEMLWGGAPESHLHPSSQAEDFYNDLLRHKTQLEARGVRFDYARLAVQGCRYCGLCLYGCPYDSIYSAASTLHRLRNSNQIDYTPGVVVDRLSSTSGRVRIEARSVEGNVRRIFEARHVFLGAGVLETVRIVSNSTNNQGRPIQIRHSDIFTLPVLRYRSTRNVASERLHTLCQVVARIDDDAVCSRPVRLQFYGYNDLYPTLLKHRFGWMTTPLWGRLLIAFGYLHSDVSSTITATALNGRLQIEGHPHSGARRIVAAVSRKLLRETLRLRAVPVGSEVRLDFPGGGYHSGAAFPMRRRPQNLETDCWGRLQELPGVHLIDASILPSVPAIPLGFTVMANAYRIAGECSLPDVA